MDVRALAVTLPFEKKFAIPYAKLRPGPNQVVVQAYNEKGAREDAAGETVLRASPAKERRLLGLFVGVSEFNNRKDNLLYARKDAEAFAAAFARQQPGKLYTEVVKPVVLRKNQPLTPVAYPAPFARNRPTPRS